MKQKLVFLTILLAALSALSAEYFVDASRPDDTGSATNWATAKRTIQAAVDLTTDGDTVWVTNGIYSTGGAVTRDYGWEVAGSLTNRVCVTNAITIRSVNGADATFIQGASDNGENGPNAARCACLLSSAVMEGFTLFDGHTLSAGSYDASGGGAFLSENATLNNCILRGNSAGWGGGGVFCLSGGTLNNCVLSGNSANDYGGGVFFAYGGGALNNCTVSGNTVDFYAGGVVFDHGGVVNNSIVWGNTAGDSWNDIYNLQGEGVVFYTCASDGIAHGVDGCITNNPLFADSSCRLSLESPCIDAGTNGYAAGEVDLDGNPRILYGRVDIGAYEYQSDLPRYTILATAGTNGSITPTSLSVFQGLDQTFSIQPNTGYVIDTLTVDGNPVAVTSSYTFTNVQSAHAIAVTFAAVSYTLTVTGGSGSGSYAYETAVPVSADVALEGFVFTGWTASSPIYMNHLSNASAASTIFTMPATNVVLTANFRRPVIYVDASRPDDSGDGESWATAKQTIQAAVDLTIDGDTVWVANGTYSQFSVTNAITIQSVNGPDVTVVWAQHGPYGGYRCASLCSEAILKGFTLTGGSWPSGGGVSGGVLYDCTLAGNGAENGGGACESVLNNCVLTGNSAKCGGGAYNCVLNDCIVSGNSVSDPRPNFYLGDYISQSYGGGVFDCTLDRCILQGNVAGTGGGGASGGSLRNCLIIGNEANGRTDYQGGDTITGKGGGALDAVLESCTIVGNAAGRGAGIFGGSANNSIGYNNVTLTSIVYLYPIGAETSNTPLFVDPGTGYGLQYVPGNLRLQARSPYVNSGSNELWMVDQVDLDGNPRIVAGIVDVGAYESEHTKGVQFITDFLPASESSFSVNDTICLSAIGGVSGNPVTFTNLPGPPIVWVNSTTIQFSAAGDVYITANQDGGTNYLSETVTNHYVIYGSGPFYVDASRPDDSGAATNWTTAKKTIQAAVDLAADGAVIWVTNGVYDAGGTTSPDGVTSNRVCITKNVRLTSVNGPVVTVIQGNGPFGLSAVRCAYLSSGATLSGVTLRGGYTCEVDPGIPGSAPFYVPTYTGVPIKGGGAYLYGNALIENCIISENNAVFEGGGAYLESGGELRNCLITGNSAGDVGGGVTLSLGGTLNNCTFFGNISSKGGGVCCSPYWRTVRQGLIWSWGGAFQGAVYNSIVWGNIAGTGSNTFSSGVGSNIYQNTCSDSALSGAGNIGANPIFIDAETGDFRLQSNSPCINWGNNSYVTNATDLAGNPRIVEGAVDMGAYEYQGAIGLADSDSDGINDDWERQHGGNQNPGATCSNGVNTIFQAYVAGLDPKNPQSRFLMSAEKSPEFENILRWNATSGRVYAVYYATNLLENFQPLETNIPWTADSFTDTVHSAYGQMYYKLDVRLGE